MPIPPLPDELVTLILQNVRVGCVTLNHTTESYYMYKPASWPDDPRRWFGPYLLVNKAWYRLVLPFLHCCFVGEDASDFLRDVELRGSRTSVHNLCLTVPTLAEPRTSEDELASALYDLAMAQSQCTIAGHAREPQIGLLRSYLVEEQALAARWKAVLTSVAPHVRELRVADSLGHRTRPEEDYPDLATHDFFHMLTRVQRVLQLHLLPVFSSLTRLSLPNHDFCTIAANAHLFPAIKELGISLALRESELDVDLVATMPWPPLDKLSISIPVDDLEDWAGVIERCFLAPSRQTLRELSLRSSAYSSFVHPSAFFLAAPASVFSATYPSLITLDSWHGLCCAEPAAFASFPSLQTAIVDYDRVLDNDTHLQLPSTLRRLQVRVNPDVNALPALARAVAASSLALLIVELRPTFDGPVHAIETPELSYPRADVDALVRACAERGTVLAGDVLDGLDTREDEAYDPRGRDPPVEWALSVSAGGARGGLEGEGASGASEQDLPEEEVDDEEGDADADDTSASSDDESLDYDAEADPQFEHLWSAERKEQRRIDDAVDRLRPFLKDEATFADEDSMRKAIFAVLTGAAS
ncbi:hypothetical protein JCM10450v2_000135 [Rhodotorula kratochvilovae]